MISIDGALYPMDSNHGELDRVTPDGSISRVIDISAAVGHVPENGGNGGVAVMVLTTDAPVPETVLDEILSGDAFFEARFVAL